MLKAHTVRGEKSTLASFQEGPCRAVTGWKCWSWGWRVRAGAASPERISGCIPGGAGKGCSCMQVLGGTGRDTAGLRPPVVRQGQSLPVSAAGSVTLCFYPVGV